MANIDLRCEIDATEINEAFEVLLRHMADSPEVEECFYARFPNVIDCVETKAGAGVAELRIELSDAFRSFIQDLTD